MTTLAGSFGFKYDGFRGLCYIKEGRCRFVSRNGNPLSRFDRGMQVAAELDGLDAAIDGEVTAADETGRPQFYDLIRATRTPTYVAFDISVAHCRRPALFAAQRASPPIIPSMPACQTRRFGVKWAPSDRDRRRSGKDLRSAGGAWRSAGITEALV